MAPHSGKPRPLNLAPITVGPEQAAALLSISRDTFDRHVQHELRWIRRGRRKLVPVRDLEEWAERNAARTLEP
jgi:excisionase family DNA binding protein